MMKPVSTQPTDAERPWGTLYFSPYGSMYVGGGILNDLHRHYTASVSFSLEGEYRIATNAEDDWQTFHGSLVAPNVEQRMDARECRVVILQIDPETESFDRIAHWFEHGPIQSMSAELSEALANDTRDALSQSSFDALELWTRIIARLSQPTFVRRHIDPRIARALVILKQQIADPPAAADLAAAVGLSEGRLTHLFSQEMGLPMRRYILWLRLREVVLALAVGAGMTEAAHTAGFADSAHMSRTFREMFGLPPSLFLKTSRAVQVAFVLPAEDDPSLDPSERARWAELRAKLAASVP